MILKLLFINSIFIIIIYNNNNIVIFSEMIQVVEILSHFHSFFLYP